MSADVVRSDKRQKYSPRLGDLWMEEVHLMLRQRMLEDALERKKAQEARVDGDGDGEAGSCTSSGDAESKDAQEMNR